MNNEIDKKLEEVLAYTFPGLETYEGVIAQLKKVFADEGWTFPQPNIEPHNFENPCMTGQQWYSCWMKDMGLFTQEQVTEFCNSPIKLYDYMIETAKRVAGLDE